MVRRRRMLSSYLYGLTPGKSLAHRPICLTSNDFLGPRTFGQSGLSATAENWALATLISSLGEISAEAGEVSAKQLA